jgi:hypothetical protein
VRGTSIIAVHGIGNQKPGATKAAVEAALTITPSPAVKELHWAGSKYQARSWASARWIARTVSFIPVLACLPDDRDTPSKSRVISSDTNRLGSLLWASLFAFYVYSFFGLRGIWVVLTFYGLAVRSASNRRLVARLALITVPVVLALPRFGPLWMTSVLVVPIGVFLMPGRLGFLRSVALAKTADEEVLPVKELGELIHARVAATGSVMVVAHSMGGYLTLRALQWLEANHPALSLPRVTVLALGSGARSLWVLSNAQDDRKARWLGWACIGSAVVSVVGLIASAEAVFLARRTGEAEDVSVLSLLWGAPHAASLPNVLSSPLVVGSVAFIVGASLTSRCAVAFRGRLRDEPSIPQGIRWIDCTSVHDSVGRVCWPRMLGAERVPIGGFGLPIPDHLMDRYLRNDVCKGLLNLLAKSPRSRIDGLRNAGWREVERTKEVDDQRDCILLGTVGMIAAVTNDAIRPDTGSAWFDALAVLSEIGVCFLVGFFLSRLLRLPKAPQFVRDVMRSPTVEGLDLARNRLAVVLFYGVAALAALWLLPSAVAQNAIGKTVRISEMTKNLDGNSLLNVYLLLTLFFSFHAMASVMLRRSTPRLFLLTSFVTTLLLLLVCFVLATSGHFLLAMVTPVPNLVILGVLLAYRSFATLWVAQRPAARATA